MKKEILIGVLIGLACNAIGFFIVTNLLSQGNDFIDVIKASAQEDILGKLISLGAIFNLFAFFIFIKRRQDYRARGVLLITVFVAILTFVMKLF